jgi:hypothetical protein
MIDFLLSGTRLTTRGVGRWFLFLRRRDTRIITIVAAVLYPAWISISSFLYDQTITFKVEGFGDVKVPREATIHDFLNEIPFFLLDATILGVSALIGKSLVGARTW